MKLHKKILYRAFQRVMYLAIPLLPYREPKLLNGNEEIIDVIKKSKISSVMIVTGKRIRSHGLTTKLEEQLNNNSIKYTVFDDTLQNPTSGNVEDARILYLNNQCEAIIAFGGGSVMDCAKALGARIVKPNKPLRKMQGLIKICKKLPLLIAIPTTAGSGSETTVAAVITDSETHHKYVISDFCLIPKYAVISPEITVNLPQHITSTTGMDALTHAVEAYIGRSRTKKTKNAAEEAVKLIFDNLETVYFDGNNIEARKNMLHASYLAGLAFTKSYVGYVHAIAHTLGGRYGVAHGLANAILLPKVLRAYKKHAVKRLAELAKAINLVSADMNNEEAANIFITHIEEMNSRMNIPANFNCIDNNDIPMMAKLAAKEANPLYPVPVLWDAMELEKIYII